MDLKNVGPGAWKSDIGDKITIRLVDTFQTSRVKVLPVLLLRAPLLGLASPQLPLSGNTCKTLPAYHSPYQSGLSFLFAAFDVGF